VDARWHYYIPQVVSVPPVLWLLLLLLVAQSDRVLPDDPPDADAHELLRKVPLLNLPVLPLRRDRRERGADREDIGELLPATRRQLPRRDWLVPGGALYVVRAAAFFCLLVHFFLAHSFVC
tara:strand:+ start:150 stop:512 length:363 start_codon:yes stop_codon:yes gene_type:complete